MYIKLDFVVFFSQDVVMTKPAHNNERVGRCVV